MFQCVRHSPFLPLFCIGDTVYIDGSAGNRIDRFQHQVFEIPCSFRGPLTQFHLTGGEGLEESSTPTPPVL